MSNEEKSEVIQEYDDLIHSLQNKYKINNLNYEEVHQELLTHLCNKLDDYDKNLAKLSTYIYVVTNNKLKNMIRSKYNHYEEKVSIEENNMEELLSNLPSYSPSERIALEIAFNIARENDNCDIIIRILKGETQTNIAKELKVTRKRINNIWREFIKEVKENI